MVVFKNLNSTRTRFITWTNEDTEKPTVTPEGDPIPINTFGINMDTLKVEYWNGVEWKPSGRR